MIPTWRDIQGPGKQFGRPTPVWLALAALWLLTPIGCSDDGSESSQDSPPLVIDQVEGTQHQPGGLVSVSGNFIQQTPDDIELDFAGDELPVRLMTPSRLVGSIPLRANTNVLEVSDSDDSRSLNLGIGDLSKHVVLEVEPNDDVESAQVVSWNQAEAKLLMRGLTDEAGDEAPAKDSFLLRTSGVEGGRIRISVDQSQHSRSVPLELVVAYPELREAGRIKSNTGEDISLLIDLLGTDLLVTVEAPTGWADQRYDVDVQLLPLPEDSPERGVAFFAANQEPALPPLDLGCDRPAVLDVDDDNVPDVLCDTIPGGIPAESLRGVETRWADVDGDGNLDAFVVGPGPRTNRLIVQATRPDAQERTDAIGLGGVTGSSLVTAHFSDLDGDGNADLFTVPRAGAPEVHRNIEGRFEPWQPWDEDPFPPGVEIMASAVFDVDNDGDQDWLLLGRDEAGDGVSIRLGNENGTLRRSAPSIDPFFGYRQVRVLAPVHLGDDRFVDLLVADEELGVFIHEGDGGFGSGAFEGPEQLTEQRGVHQVSFFDVNVDGNRDLLLSHYGGLSVFLRQDGMLLDWRALSGLPLGLGASAVGLRNRDGEPVVEVDGQRWEATVGNFEMLVVRVEREGLVSNGARLELTWSDGILHEQLGMQGTGVVGAVDERKWYFPPGFSDPVAVAVEFPDGRRLERSVTEFPATIVVE